MENLFMKRRAFLKSGFLLVAIGASPFHQKQNSSKESLGLADSNTIKDKTTMEKIIYDYGPEFGDIKPISSRRN